MSDVDYVKYTVADYINLDKFISSKIHKFIENHKRIFIYGAGDIGRRIWIYLHNIGISANRIVGYLVSDNSDNIDNVYGVKIYKADEADFTDAGVLLALSYKHHASVICVLNDCGCNDWLALDEYEYTHIYWSNHHITPEMINFYNKAFPVKRVNSFDIKLCKKVLLICTDSIGDEVINIPFIRELRKNLPYNGKITIVVQPSVAQFMNKCPYIDNLIVYDAKANAGYNAEESVQKSKIYAEKYLQSEDYDAVILHGWFSVHLEYLFLAVFSSSEIRIGFSEHNMDHKEYCNMGFDNFLSIPVKSTVAMNEVERDIEMLSAIGGKIECADLEFWTEDKDKKFAERIFDNYALNESRVIAIVPVAADGARMWPWKKYGALIKKLLEHHSDIAFVLLGGNDSIKVCENIAEYVDSTRIVNLSGKTDLCEAAEIFKRCFLYIGCDTGLMHIAAAVKLTTMQIVCHAKDGDPLEYSSVARYRAWGNKSYVIRPKKALPGCGATCYMRREHCIAQISVDEVFSVVNNILKKMLI